MLACPMPSVTYYVALPFVRTPDGELVGGEAKELSSARAAVSAARLMGLDHTACGAVAFSRTGDPDVGEFSDAVLIEKFGLVPDDLSGL